MKRALLVVVVYAAALPASQADPARVPGCHPSGIDATWRANLDRDRQLERVVRRNVSCAHEATLHIADTCGGRTRVHQIRGVGLLGAFQVTEANARADGQELVVAFRRLKPTERYRGGAVVVHLEARRKACARLVYLFAYDLEAPPANRELTDLDVEVTQLEPASPSKELRIVEVFGDEGQREHRARYDAQTGRFSIYETTASGA